MACNRTVYATHSDSARCSKTRSLDGKQESEGWACFWIDQVDVWADEAKFDRQTRLANMGDDSIQVESHTCLIRATK